MMRSSEIENFEKGILETVDDHAQLSHERTELQLEHRGDSTGELRPQRRRSAMALYQLTGRGALPENEY